MSLLSSRDGTVIATDTRAQVAAEEGGPATSSWASRKEADAGGAMLFSEGDLAYEAMLADIAVARTRVWIESYIFEDDAIGQAFIAQLADCAARGVDVRVRVDALGSHFGFSGGSARRLRASGVQFHWCHPWEWRRPWAYHRRNHRKLLVVDSLAAYLGGLNISNLNSRRVHGEARWRDTHVRLSGAVVEEAAAAYAAFAHGQLKWHGDESRPLYLLTNHAHGCRHRLRCVLRQQFADARERVWLTTPYFVPDSATQRELCAAAERGVDVRVLVPGKNDVALVQWAGRAAYSLLLRAGARVFEYEPRTLHAKTLLIDRDWGTIGTANFDYRSFFINYELNLIADSACVNASLATLFENDLREAREICERPWANRPLRSRAAELVGWSARHWL